MSVLIERKVTQKAMRDVGFCWGISHAKCSLIDGRDFILDAKMDFLVDFSTSILKRIKRENDK